MDYIEQMKQDEELKRLMAISKANELVIEMQHEVDKYTKLLHLAKEDQVYTVTHNINYFDLLFRIIPAKDYFHAPKDIDKRSAEYKGNKKMFESLEKYLEENIFHKKVTIIEMASGGYESYYEQMNFKIPDCDTTFSFSVPNPERISTTNFEYAYQGKLAFGYYSGTSCLYLEETSYKVEDITKAFEKFLKEQKNETEETR